MNHYTYQITKISIQKHYIGCRSTKFEPYDDLGKNYFSSSADSDFKKDQKNNPDDFMYNVLKVFDSREEATQHEIYLHKINQVSKNPKFYNRSMQTSTKFDTTGLKLEPLSEERKALISKTHKGKKVSQESINKMLAKRTAKDENGVSEYQKTNRKVALVKKTTFINGLSIEQIATNKMVKTRQRKDKDGLTSYQKSARKMIKTKQSQPDIICPHCGKVGKGGVSKAAMTRWHFENCKYKNDVSPEKHDFEFVPFEKIQKYFEN